MERKESTQLKANIKELTKELNERIKYMDGASIESITRLSAWINKDAHKLLKT